MPVADTLVDTDASVTDASPTTHVDPQSATAFGFVPQQSRAERAASFDVAAFPLPSGREEEWRFTPVKKLAPLLAEGASGHLDWTTSLPEGVATSTISGDWLMPSTLRFHPD